ncbi:MAG: hypothetical protein ACOC3W_10040, partial [Thermodesulfobacteriota bacterium]
MNDTARIIAKSLKLLPHPAGRRFGSKDPLPSSLVLISAVLLCGCGRNVELSSESWTYENGICTRAASSRMLKLMIKNGGRANTAPISNRSND